MPTARLSQNSGALTADNALDLVDLFARLRKSRMLVQDLRATRAHKALQVMTRAGAHWPEKLVEAASGVLEVWTRTCGPLECIRPDLFGAGARLAGVADRNVLNADARLETALWMRENLTLPKGAIIEVAQ